MKKIITMIALLCFFTNIYSANVDKKVSKQEEAKQTDKSMVKTKKNNAISISYESYKINLIGDDISNEKLKGYNVGFSKDFEYRNNFSFTAMAGFSYLNSEMSNQYSTYENDYYIPKLSFGINYNTSITSLDVQPFWQMGLGYIFGDQDDKQSSIPTSDSILRGYLLESLFGIKVNLANRYSVFTQYGLRYFKIDLDGNSLPTYEGETFTIGVRYLF